jgi:Domain of unknown function (DUF4430)
VRSVVLVAAVLALAGCGGGHTHGTATLWVTQDHGTKVLFAGKVPAGLTAMQTLTRVEKVGTRYGGRYVQSIDGVSGSLSAEKDWFFFVNGVESGTGASEVKLRPGDTEWWDYRSWKGSGMTVPVVVGAFPEPFVHGFQWAKPGATIKGGGALATLLQRLIPAGPNEIDIESTVPPDEAVAERHGNKVVLVLGARIAEKLSSDPTALRYQYQVPK